jgi:gliotoxin biosynthesis cytochrome P450 monooxygenase
VLPLPQPWVILPNSLVDEIKSLPDSHISFRQLNWDLFHRRYTGLGQNVRNGEQPEVIDAIKLDLTRNTAKVLHDLQDEVVYAFNKEIGKCSEPMEVRLYGTVLQIVAILSARTFVGLPLSRDKEWTDATINFTMDVMAAVRKISSYNSFLRPLIVPFLPELKKLSEYRKLAAKKIGPQVNKILQAYSNKADGLPPTDLSDAEVLEGDFHLLHWTLSHFKDVRKANPTTLGQAQLSTAIAAIHPAGQALCHAIFDLAAHPEIVPELRSELQTVIAEEGHSDAKLRKTGLAKLRKLDSFIKESLRFNPQGLSE